MASTSDGLNVLAIGLEVAGIVTLLIGLMGFCSRRSKCIVVLNLFLQILLLCAYMIISVFYLIGKACELIHSENQCEELEDKVSTNIIRYFLLAVNGSIVSLVCESIVVWDYIGLFL